MKKKNTKKSKEISKEIANNAPLQNIAKEYEIIDF
jgi:hypothetical protein